LYIGPGTIDSESLYKGSNVQDGEDTKTGVLVIGENYGVLIQNGSLAFNHNFGGILSSIATAGGDFTIEQFGGFGNIDPPYSFLVGDISTLLRITGISSATLESFQFGSSPQADKDAFYANTHGWANGDSTYFFSGKAMESEITTEVRVIGQGNVDIEALFETLEVNSYFQFDNY